MNLNALLTKRHKERGPLRVGLIGAGKFGSMYLAQAKETRGIHLAAKHDLPGILLLCHFTGAAREWDYSVQINPYAIEEYAESINAAVEMPEEEKRRRMMLKNTHSLLKE